MTPLIPQFVDNGYSILTNWLNFSYDYKLAYKLGITVPNPKDYLYKKPFNNKVLHSINEFLKPENIRKNGDRFKFHNIQLGAIFESIIHPLFLPISKKLINRLGQFHNLSQQFKLKSFITWTDAGIINRAMTLYASSNSIPSFVIQHGATAEAHGYVYPVADYFLAWGENSKKWMINHNVNKNKMLITGNPYFEVKKRFSLINRDEKLNRYRFKIIIALSPLIGTGRVNYFENQRTMEVIVKAVSELSDIEFLWKLHRLDTIENYRINHHLSNFKIKKRRLSELYLFSDILITIDSTAGIEAMAYNLPVIVMNVMNRKLYMDYVNKAGCTEIKNETQLFYEIKKLSENRYKKNRLNLQRNYVKNYLYKYGEEALKEVFYQIKDVSKLGHIT